MPKTAQHIKSGNGKIKTSAKKDVLMTSSYTLLPKIKTQEKVNKKVA